MKKTTISIADDHLVVREGLTKILNSFEEFEVRWSAENGQDLLDKFSGGPTDIVLLDVDMPVMDGLETMRNLRAKYKNTVKIVCLSMHEEYFIVQSMLEEGADGFITKKANSQELQKAIHSVLDHDFYLSPQLSKELFGKRYMRKPDDNMLTKVEEEIIRLVCLEKNNKEIAEELKLSPNTVNAYRTKILDKTETTNAAGLVIYAVKNGIFRIT